MHYNYRVSVLASSLKEAATLLRPHIETALDQLHTSSNQAPVAFAFTGQGTGTFYTGIGAQLYRETPGLSGSNWTDLTVLHNARSSLPSCPSLRALVMLKIYPQFLYI